MDLPQFRGHGLSRMTRLVPRGTAVAEEGMPPPLVVEPLDVVEHIPPRLGPRAIGAMVDQLGLERLEEALDHRVVPAVAPPAHAGPDPVAREERLIGRAGILTALIRVVQQPPRRPPLRHGHAQGGEHELLTQDRKSTRLNSSHITISYAVFCLKKKNRRQPPSTA